MPTKWDLESFEWDDLPGNQEGISATISEV